MPEMPMSTSATLWVVCGAGKGVGKSHLARALCRALPRAQYAKLGHGKPRRGGPKPYFTDIARLEAYVESRKAGCRHLVVESNVWARTGRGDVVVFIDGIPGLTDIRPDARLLRRRADVVIGPGGSPSVWRKALRPWLGDAAEREAVLALLERQAARIPEGPLGVRTKIWLSRGEGRVFGEGLARLCESIRERRSLLAASRACRVSYRHAWNLLRTAERRLGVPLTVPRAGGAGGGGSSLSAEGVRLLALYRRMAADLAAHADARFRAWSGQAEEGS